MESYNLTKIDRLILYNQYEILRELSLKNGDQQQAERYEIFSTIVLNGYEYDYCQIFEGFSEYLLKNKSKFVMDILALYQAIYDKAKSLSVEEKDKYGYKLKFRGFDGNNEIDYFAYCKFVIKDQKKYPDLYENGSNELNSHHEIVEYYKKLLKLWKDAGEPYELSNDLFKKLMEVR